MRYILILSVLLAIFVWAAKRPKGYILPSDAFFILFITIMGIIPIVNPTAASPIASDLVFKQSVADRAMLGIALSLWVFSAVWFFRKRIDARAIYSPLSRNWLASGKSVADRRLLIIASLAALAILLPLGVPDYYSFKIRVIQFLTGNLSNLEHAMARRLEFADSGFVSNFMGRLRYAVFPALFVIFVLYIARSWGVIVAFLMGAALFVLGPASLSKLPIVAYLVYGIAALALAKGITFPFQSKNFAPSYIISILATMIVLTAAYFLQYNQYFTGASGVVDAFDLAIYRVFTAVYGSYLAHFTVYPAYGGFTGFSSIGLLGDFLGGARNVDVEVAQHFVGERGANFTSFPTAFIGAAYASFGYLGIVLFSGIVFIYLIVLDRIAAMLRHPAMVISYLSTVTFNVTFFATLPAPPVFVTYGLVSLPLIFVGLDRFLVWKSAKVRRRRPRKSAPSFAGFER